MAKGKGAVLALAFFCCSDWLSLLKSSEVWNISTFFYWNFKLSRAKLMTSCAAVLFCFLRGGGGICFGFVWGFLAFFCVKIHEVCLPIHLTGLHFLDSVGNWAKFMPLHTSCRTISEIFYNPMVADNGLLIWCLKCHGRLCVQTYYRDPSSCGVWCQKLCWLLLSMLTFKIQWLWPESLLLEIVPSSPNVSMISLRVRFLSPALGQSSFLKEHSSVSPQRLPWNERGRGFLGRRARPRCLGSLEEQLADIQRALCQLTGGRGKSRLWAVVQFKK